MDKKELEKRQKAVLSGICEAYLENDVAAAITPGDEVGSADMLIVQHTDTGKEIDEILGAYYFLPAAENIGPFQYFVTTLTLSEEIPKQAQESLTAAVAVINTLISFGTFTISPDKTVISYRHVTLLPDDTGEDILSLTVHGTMLNALSEVAVWADELDALEYGRITYDEFLKFCHELQALLLKQKKM